MNEQKRLKKFNQIQQDNKFQFPPVQLYFYHQDIFIQFIVKNMSQPIMEKQTQATNSKLEIVGDILAFLSIVSAYQFLSLTYNFKIFQGFLGLTLDSFNDIVFIYILYALLIFLLKFVAILIKLVKKGEEVDSVIEINAAINRSLFAVFFVMTVYVATLVFGLSLEISILSQIAIWLFVAELNLIFCQLLKKVSILQNVALFGWSIEVIIVGGQLARLLSFDFFEFL